MSDLWDKIQADQERQDSKTRAQYPRHRATVRPRYQLRWGDDPWTPEIVGDPLGWQVFCACRPSEVTNFPPDRENAARAWRCPRSRRRK